MSVKVKVSYTDEKEIDEIEDRLHPLVNDWKRQPANGKYKRAYGKQKRATEKLYGNKE